MSLRTYKQKRDFKKTSEPKPKVKIKRRSAYPKLQSEGAKKLIYVIQKHNASHLHYDFRLEMSGVLKSWAIPKEPPKVKGIKRLAIQTEDHPMDYATYEGEIPEGEYGAGKVKIWDKGTYELKDKDEKKIEVILKGKKLKGNYVLIKTKYGAKPEKSWLFFKTK